MNMAECQKEALLAKQAQKAKKDAKNNPILFSLAGRATEPWPDHDSSDSDYVPDYNNDVPLPKPAEDPPVKITIR